MERFSFGQDGDTADEAIAMVAPVKRLPIALQYAAPLCRLRRDALPENELRLA
jgi:hypothetical protein